MRFGKSEIQKVIQKNRDRHVEMYDRAFEGWKEEVETAQNNISSDSPDDIGQMKDDVQELMHLIDDEPTSHVHDYDLALDMMDNAIDKEIEIDSEMYEMYAMDNWDWTDEFMDSVKNYSKQTA